MNFNSHPELENRHAYLSPSKYHWLGYDDDKLASTYANHLGTMRGTELHELASVLIRLKQKLPDTGQTLNMYVNDAISYRMRAEIPLFYSRNAFGTADAIGLRFDKETGRHKLRIHDLKTGFTPTSMKQLIIYAAFFCLEYGFKPADIDIELRIYQNDDVTILIPEVFEVMQAMDKTITADQVIEEVRSEQFS